jgi:hypothetical protein
VRSAVRGPEAAERDGDERVAHLGGTQAAVRSVPLGEGGDGTEQQPAGDGGGGFAAVRPPLPLGHLLHHGPAGLELGDVRPVGRSPDTEELSEFGATACKALRRCRSCREPFEHVKEL